VPRLSSRAQAKRRVPRLTGEVPTGVPGPGRAPSRRASGGRALRRGPLVLLLAALTVLCAAGGVALGSVPVPVAEELRIIWRALVGASQPAAGGVMQTIVLEFRLPRVLTAALVGTILSLCGAAMQGVFRNPLADPYLLGVAGGATAGVAAAIFLGWSGIPFIVPLAAFGGGLIAVAIVFGMAGKGAGSGLDNVALILAGVALAALFSAITALFLFLSGERERTGIVFWVMGGLAGSDWFSVWLLLPVALVGGVAIWFFGRELNALALGDEQAAHLGVDARVLKRILLLLTTLMTAFAVAMSGTIGFVGLIVPHGMRLLIGPDHRWLLPTSALAGAAFLVISDAAARTVIAPAEIPVGIVTAVVGGPVFLYLLRSRLLSRKAVARGAW
jgi:iron complex transport system permease protein